MNNVTLIGMPGSGKSTIGVILAKALRYEFLDSDLLIQKQEKRKLSEIIEQDGPEKFKEIENQVNADIHVTDTTIAIFLTSSTYLEIVASSLPMMSPTITIFG